MTIFYQQGRMVDIFRTSTRWNPFAFSRLGSADSREAGQSDKVNKPYRLAGERPETPRRSTSQRYGRLSGTCIPVAFHPVLFQPPGSDPVRLVYSGQRLNETITWVKITKRKNRRPAEAWNPSGRGAESKEEKALLSIQFLNNTIEWDSYSNLVSDQDLTDCLQRKGGQQQSSTDDAPRTPYPGN